MKLEEFPHLRRWFNAMVRDRPCSALTRKQGKSARRRRLPSRRGSSCSDKDGGRRWPPDHTAVGCKKKVTWNDQHLHVIPEVKNEPTSQCNSGNRPSDADGQLRGMRREERSESRCAGRALHVGRLFELSAGRQAAQSVPITRIQLRPGCADLASRRLLGLHRLEGTVCPA